jgi:hypothetical protein
MMIVVIAIIVMLAKIIGGSLFSVVAILAFNMQSIASSNNNVDVLLDRANMAELFGIGSGIFAVILCTLSLRAYRNLKSTRMLLVSAAFGMFAAHAILSRLDVLIPAIAIESSVLELIVSIISFVSLAFFFLAIVTKSKMKAKTRTPPPTS